MKRLTVHQASNHLDDLVDAAMAGEEVVLTKNNQPAVKLVPVKSNQGGARPQFGSAAGLISMSDDFDEPLDDFTEYTR